MKHLLVTVLAITSVSAGCRSITGPDTHTSDEPLLQHCTTQPRLYTLPNGKTQWEIDTYTAAFCPEEPIR